MKQFSKLRAASLLAALFVAVIYFVGLKAFPDFVVSTITVPEQGISLRQYIQNTDRQYQQMLPETKEAGLLHNKGTYINFNGYLARLMGQQMLNGRVKLLNGHLAELFQTNPSDAEIRSIAENIGKLSHYQTQQGKHFLFVLAPAQVSKYENLLPTGYTDTTNHNADRLLEQLNTMGIPFLDLREALYEDGLSHTDAFFVTDHHWTPQAGFWAYGRILKELESMNAIDPIAEKYIRAENYDFTIHEAFFLGSSGKRTGIYYAGVDDFCVISPKFETHITVEIAQTESFYEGPYAQSTNNPFWDGYFEEPDYFSKFPYDVYGRSDGPPTLRLNENAPQDGRFLLIGDSFGNIPFSFFSIYTQNSYELDMRAFEEDFPTLIGQYDPDTVILLANTVSYGDVNVSYPFFPE